MFKSFIVIAALTSAPAFAEYQPVCQTQADKHGEDLDSGAEYVEKSALTDVLENSELEAKEVAELRVWIAKESTEVYSYSNDAGAWIAVADKSDACKIVWSRNVYGY